MTEQDIIARYFSREQTSNAIAQRIGDDAAIVNVPPGQQLVMSMDTLNANVHFPYSSTHLMLESEQAWHTNAFDIGFKSAAVNLSDLAAMGAQPTWITLSLSVPELNEAWLAQFSEGLYSLLDKYQVNLIGGDLNNGPLSITLQAEGLVPMGGALLRSTAKPGDLLFVSGELGTAAYALQQLKKGDASEYLTTLTQPTPRVELGLALRGLATSCIDLSDGLLRDLNRIIQASQVGLQIDVSALPVSTSLQNTISEKKMARLALSGGDDYQLCFSIAAKNKEKLIAICEKLQVSLSQIGVVTDSQELALLHNPLDENESLQGFDHFQ